MATRQTSQEEQPETATAAGSARPHSLKEEIIQKIRQQEEMKRETVGVYEAGGAEGTIRSLGEGSGIRTDSRERARTWRNVFGGAGTHDMAMYCRQLATLIDVGIPLLRALQILAERSSNRRLRDVSRDMARRVEEGQPFSTALAAHPATFDNSFVSVVRAGEAGGILDESLRRLADLLERRNVLAKRILSALAYPAFALLIELAVVAFIVFWAFPKLLAAYPDPTKLPGPTLALLAFTHWVAANWFIVVLLVVAVVAAAVLVFRVPRARAVWDSVVLRLPLLGGLSRKVNVARFARTLGSLVAAGIPLLDALTIAAETANNAVVERTLLRVRDNVENGGKMEEPMRQEPVFDPIVVDMVMVGDEAGALDTVMLKVADTYDAEVDASLRAITSLVEPLLIIFLGVAVGFIAVAVFLPYVSLVRNPTLLVE